MNTLPGNEWFTEIHAPGGTAFSLRIKGLLHEEQTPFQRLAIYDTDTFGHLMVLDGCVMLTTRDNFLYHEMLAHPALFTHPAPRRVLIIGGGDCGTLREVLRHPGVEEAVQVEIDAAVTRAAERWFPELCEANGDPRARLLFDDGIRHIAECAPGHYDVILVDSTDPVGPAEGLFNETFYASCQRALGANGVLAAQSESPLLHLDLIRSMQAALHAAGFAQTRTLPFPQPVYPSGWWSITLAAKQAGSIDEFRDGPRTFATRYYNAAIHRGALTPPEFMR